jgi:hypothetical protein
MSANITRTDVHKPPDRPSFEEIRLEVAKRRVEARSDAVKENLALLEQLSREIKNGDSYE